MFTRIQTRHFRSLKGVDQSLGPIQALVGPNASGKTTFLDVVGLLSDLIRQRGDVREVVFSRSGSFEKLVWQGGGTSQAFQLAVEAPIPAEVRERMADDKKQYAVVRYELEIGMDQASNQLGLNHETLWLRTAEPERDAPQRALFPAAPDEAPNLLSQSRKGSRVALKKVPSGNDNYYPEGSASYTPSFKLGRAKAALANIPADEKSFPVSSWFRSLLESGVQKVVLNSQTIRQPSPPGLGFRFQTDGSNLPWVIAVLRRDEDRFTAWLEHVRTALEDVTLTRWRGKRTGTGTWSSATRMAPKCLLGWFRTGRFGSWR
jgi:hypothetical protein